MLFTPKHRRIFDVILVSCFVIKGHNSGDDGGLQRRGGESLVQPRRAGLENQKINPIDVKIKSIQTKIAR